MKKKRTERKFKVLVLLTLLCLMSTFVLTSCGIKIDEAKEYITEFFGKVSAEDYEAAEAMLHPANTTDLKTFFEDLKRDYSTDFTRGFAVKYFTGFRSSVYTSEVDGSALELNMIAELGEENVEIAVTIVDNDEGYGIYSFRIYPSSEESPEQNPNTSDSI